MATTRARRLLGNPSRSLADLVPWLVRGLWTALPFAAGPALAAALDGASTPVRTVASIGLWAGWGAGAGAAFVCHPVTLTTLRILAPAALITTLLSAAGGHPSALAVAWAAVTTGWAMSPAVGHRWVNGPAYGDERRYLLRIPGPLLFGGLALVWAVAMIGIASGPLLMAAGRWVPGTGALLFGWTLAALLVKSMHNLSRRWVVFVPAGLVLHDPVSLVDPVLFPRRVITSLAPASGRTGGTADFTQRAPGLGLELAVSEPAPVMVMRPGHREGEPREVDHLRFTPTRPGAVLEEARRRRIVGRR